MKNISKVWTFNSSSSNKTYETLQYDDGETSCNCPGWTRRVSENGTRSCKHTRAVDMGVADDQAVASTNYATSMASQKPKYVTPSKEKEALIPTRRIIIPNKGKTTTKKQTPISL